MKRLLVLLSAIIVAVSSFTACANHQKAGHVLGDTSKSMGAGDLEFVNLHIMS